MVKNLMKFITVVAAISSIITLGILLLNMRKTTLSLEYPIVNNPSYTYQSNSGTINLKSTMNASTYSVNAGMIGNKIELILNNTKKIVSKDPQIELKFYNITFMKSEIEKIKNLKSMYSNKTIGDGKGGLTYTFDYRDNGNLYKNMPIDLGEIDFSNAIISPKSYIDVTIDGENTKRETFKIKINPID